MVNEAIADGAKLPADGNWKSCLRNTPWLKNIGDDYIELAFRFAHEADPNAELYYNDYNLNDKNKAEIAAAMFTDLKKRGAPIDGIGMQSHYNTELSLSSVEQSVKRFRDAGAKISATELDVVINNPSESAVAMTDEGYLVEIRIPMTMTLTENMSMGFDVQINDSNERGERISVAKFNDDTDNSWQSAERWGVLELK